MLLSLGHLYSLMSEVDFLLPDINEETPDLSGTSRTKEEEPDLHCTIKKEDRDYETPLMSIPLAPLGPQNETYIEIRLSPEERVQGLCGLSSLLVASGMTKDVSALSTQDFEDILSKFDQEKSSTGGPSVTVTSSGPDPEVYTLEKGQTYRTVRSRPRECRKETIQSQCIDMMRDALDRALLEDLFRHFGATEGMTPETISHAVENTLSWRKDNMPRIQRYLERLGVVFGESQ